MSSTQLDLLSGSTRLSLTSGVCVLFPLIVTVSSLRCEECVNMMGNSCTGSERTCMPYEDSCTSVYMETLENTRELKPNVVFMKGCARSLHCILEVSLHTENYMRRTAYKCCRSDLCDNGIVTLPATSTILNGLQCPSCFAVNTFKCKGTSKIKCMGDENQCIQYSGFETKGNITKKFAVQGCATKSMCLNQESIFIDSNVTQNIIVQCSSAIVHLHQSLFIPALIGLLLMKLLR